MEATLNKFKEGARADKSISPFPERRPQQVKRDSLRIFCGRSGSRLFGSTKKLKKSVPHHFYRQAAFSFFIIDNTGILFWERTCKYACVRIQECRQWRCAKAT
jgi:hypothetical protein